MSATERLRELLNELHNLACDINEEEIRSHSVITLNQGRYNRQLRLDMNHDWLNAWHAELERILQAIAATLGSCSLPCNCTNGGRTDGTCRVDCFDDGVDEGLDGEWFSYAPPTWYLSCGHEVYDSECPRFCPVCGREVVDE